ncbi:MAG: 50S ribosomal protein L27 [Patescibacteria group bacterium]
MAHKKAGGSTKNDRDSGPQYLGIKVNQGEKASAGAVLVRQRGTDVLPGKNVGMGKDHTLYAGKAGLIEFKKKRKVNFDNTESVKKVINVI